MSSSCPYCGAVLKLKFCVVCGRQSKLNKMGHLHNTARNTDATQRLEDPFYEEEIDPQKSLRFHKNVRPIAEASISGLIAGVLIFCAAKQALDFYGSENINDVVGPWMKSHHFELPARWPVQPADAVYKADQHKKKQQKNKSNKVKGK
jgi:hypothetical protein